ncbi:MAG TPA: sulfate ABC transporter ATP-binding protein [Gemmatimonadaceae bacterium]|nr:sulfate ABC transporter ATP-binding protein [Gemmatimonadaceae bacterium]
MSIEVEHLTKRFGSFLAVDDVSFRVAPGELVALLGPSGGGKSTILRIIAGLERADSGTVSIGEDRVEHLDARDRRVGFVFQHYALFRHMNVRENIGFGLRVADVKEKERRARVDELLALMGLDGFAERMPAQLSGGQRQRVALARALAPRPRLLLLDEPFAAIDAKVRQELRTWLRALHDETHVTSVFVTHDQEEAFALAERVMILNHGRLEQAGSPTEIVDSPATEFVAQFVADANSLSAEIRGGRAIIGALSIPAPDFPDCRSARVVIRAYELKLWRSDTEAIADVRRVSALGDRVRVDVNIDGGPAMFGHFPRRSGLLEGVTPGSRVALEVTSALIYPVK